MGLGGQAPVKVNTENASSMHKDVLPTLLALYFAEWRGGILYLSLLLVCKNTGSFGWHLPVFILTFPSSGW